MSADRLVPKFHGRPLARRAESAFPHDRAPGPTKQVFSLHTPSLHHCLITSKMLKITSGPDGGVYFEEEYRFLGNPFTGQREHSENARTREHDTSRFDYRTPLRKVSGGGRETVQIAVREPCLWRFSSVEEKAMRL